MIAPELPPTEVVRLLLVESDAVDADRFENALHEGCPGAFAVRRADCLAVARYAAATAPFDVVVLDLDLPDSRGVETLVRMRAELPDTVPVFVLTGLDFRTDVGEIVLRSGNEYLVKSRLDHTLLPRLLRQAVERQRVQVSMLRLIASNPDGMVVVDQDGVVLFANDGAAKLFGQTDDALIGQHFGFPVQMSGSTDVNTLKNRVAEMRSVDIDWNGRQAIMVTLRDVTDRHNLMKELQASKAAADAARAEAEVARDVAVTANRVRDEILSNMNHEVRTPLNSIIGFSDLLITDEDGYSGNQTVRSYLEHIKQSGLHLLEMLTDVLDLANIMTDHFEIAEEHFDISGAVNAVCQLVRSQVVRAGLKLETNLPEEALILFADQRRVKQMLSHLLSNAIKFNQPNGQIGLSVELGAAGDLLLTISDSGVGMDMAKLDHAESAFGKIGEPLTSTTGGAGLGLSLAKGMIERHGGRLTLESAQGVGTSVTLHFPASRVLRDQPGTNRSPAMV